MLALLLRRLVTPSRCAFCLTTAGVLLSLPTYAGDKYPPKPTAADFKECEQSFTYRSKPIDPGLVAQFEGWESDSGLPVTVAVDISACFNSNQCSDGDTKVDKDSHLVRKGSIDGDQLSTAYKWLGRLSNGTHVLQTFSSGGGSGVFQSLLMTHFDKGKGYYEDGQPYDRLLLVIDRSYALGDRVEVTTKLDKDTVHLTITATVGEKTPPRKVDLVSKR